MMRTTQKSVWLACLVGIAFLSACQSPHGRGSNSLASVRIEGASAEDIHAATIDVFKRYGYSLAEDSPMRQTFQIRGTGMNQAAFGGWFDEPVWVRVKTRITPFTNGTHELACDAFMVRKMGDRVQEDSQRLRKPRRGPYQDLLDQVKQQIEGNG